MSPLNRGPLTGVRVPPAGMRAPMPGYGRVPPLPPLPGRGGMNRGMPMPPMPPMPPMYGPPRGRPLPPPPPRVGPMMGRPGSHGGPPGPMYGPGPMRGRPVPPMPPMPPMGLRGPMGPRGPVIRPGHRGILPPHALPHMRPRFMPNHTNGKGKSNNNKKSNKLEELEMKKPWMTDEIRSEIQKKNKLYAKAKKNKDAKEWDEFKDLRNKVTRMIRDAKNEYLTKNPEQVAQKTADNSTVEKESVQKTENTTEQTEQMELNGELNGENKPSSEQAHLYENDEQIEENNDEDLDDLCSDSEEEPNIPYCDVCDREFYSEEMLEKHIKEHQTCNIEGCTFTAHPKIVEKHISMQHYTGLYQRMKNLMTDEDIEKWRTERKRRYPTSANIKLQEAERLEKETRGEIIKCHNKIQKTGVSMKKDQTRKNRKRRRNKPLQIETCKESGKQEVYRGLLPFSGTAMLDEKTQIDSFSIEDEFDESKVEISDEEVDEIVQQNFNISDDEVPINEQLKESEIPVQKLTTPAAITAVTANVVASIMSLVADYGSDSDNSDEAPEEVPIKKCKIDDNLLSQKPELKSNDLPSDQTDVNLKNNTFTSTCVQKAGPNKSTKVSDNKQSVQNESRFSKDKRKPNKIQQSNSEFKNKRLRLLNKLLARSIQHERNTICQCITFIANNNFFD